MLQVDCSKNLGRFIKSIQDIQCGTEIFDEDPIAVGPKAVSKLVCLGCHKIIRIQPIYRCSICNWPVCNSECEKSQFHLIECQLLVKSKFQATIQNDLEKKQSCYAIILPLRCLILKKFNFDQYEKLIELESHLEQRMLTPYYKLMECNMIPFLKVVLEDFNVDSKEILKIFAILDTNSFDIRIDNDIRIRGIYLKASLLSHDCCPNTKHKFEPNSYRINFTAIRQIAKNNAITVTYTQIFWDTNSRRKHLKTIKYFECQCARCQDPTEFGTFIGSYYCSKCKHLDLKPKIIPINSIDFKSNFECKLCSMIVPLDVVEKKNDFFRKKLQYFNKNSSSDFECFLRDFSAILPEQNQFIISAKLALFQIYGHMSGYELYDLSIEKLEKKIELGDFLLKIGNILEPFQSQFRYDILSDLKNVIIEILKRSLIDKRNNEDLRRRLIEIEDEFRSY